MEKLLFIVLMCAVPACLAATIHTGKKEEKWKFTLDYKIVCFYFFCFLTIICLFKTVVGHGDSFLLESYSGISFKTVAHYIPILLVLAIGLPFIARLFPIKSVYFSNSLFFFGWSITYFILGGTHNLLIVILFVLSFAISFIWIVFCKKEASFYEKEERKQNIGYISSVVLFGIITTYVYIPQETFLANIQEMVISYEVYALYAVLGGVVLAVLYIAGALFFLTKEQSKLFIACFFAINFAGYLQTNFFNGELKALDGDVQTWDEKTILLNMVLWILIFLMVLAVEFLPILKKNSKKILQLAAIYISLMQVISLAVLIIGTEKNKESEYSFSKEYMLELDDEKNVIIFVLDWLDQQILEDVVASEPSVLNGFKDFTWYRNATSQYAFTYMSIPYLITGVEWENGMNEKEYYLHALEGADYLQSIRSQGYDIGIYSDHYFANEALSKLLENIVIDGKNSIPFVELFDLIEKSGRYRMAPFGIKEEYIFYNWHYEQMVYDGQYTVTRDEEFYTELLDRGITVSGDSRKTKGSFRLYHMNGAHVPFRINSNVEIFDYEKAQESGMTYKECQIEQVKGSLKIVATYMEQMKQNGLFEDATIIVTADHGQNLYMNEESRKNHDNNFYDITSTPMMFVKTAGEAKDDEIKTSFAPVTHQEVLGEVLRSIGIDSDMRTFSEIGEEEVRERTFIRGRSGDIPFKKYVINGNARDVKSWTEVPLE